MIVILKHNPKNFFSPIYFIDVGKTLPIGHLCLEAINTTLYQKKLLEPIDRALLIEQFFFSELLMSDVSENHYYYLKTNTTTIKNTTHE